MLADPGLPTTNPPPTSSFWLSDPHPSFTSPPPQPLPAHADTVIIGSGITGTSIARYLIRLRPSAASSPANSRTPNGPIVMLEARDVCSGATGRNGGHVNEVGFAEYHDLKARYGRDAAMKITRFRLAHVKEMMNVARAEGLEEESQMRFVETFNVAFGAQVWEEGKALLEEFKRDLGPEVDAWRVIERREEMEKLGVPGAYGIIAGKAGAMWPYRFVTGVLANLLRDGTAFHVFPHTPATAISVNENGLFVIDTPRGKITAKHVVHASNAHIAHLVPAFKSRVYPLRGHMSAQSPPPAFAHQGASRSWSFDYDLGFDYLTQLPLQYRGAAAGSLREGGEMMFGGGFAQTKFAGIEEMGVARDDGVNADAVAHLSKTLDEAFACGADGESKEDAGFKVKALWTGTMAFSVDMLPWVGRLPTSFTGRSAAGGSEWASAAYSGEGMVNAWLAGKALALMMLGREEEAGRWFPEEMGISEGRIAEGVLGRFVDVEGIKAGGGE